MPNPIATARAALLAGLVISALILGLWLLSSGVDRLGLASFLARFVHVLAAIVWVGMIWFVNFIQFAALEEADDAARATLMKLIVPRVAHIFRHAATLTLASGLVLLMTTGYLLDRWVFSTAVYVPAPKALLLWGGAAAAVLMWGFVQFMIWPALRILTGEVEGNAEAKSKARARVKMFARLNLVLAIPVTFVMVAAAHLY